MQNYYLRIEGVNLSNFVYDTNDLSTIRGGGLMLLESVDKIFEKLSEDKIPGFSRITQGASWGLARFKAEDDIAAENTMNKVWKFLNSGHYEHATFVVNVIPRDNTPYPLAREKLAALNRWQQMQSPSIAVPKPGKTVMVQKKDNKNKLIHACEYDGVRPAVVQTNHKDKEQTVGISASVSARRDNGIAGKKKDWYEKQTNTLNLPDFVNDLNELTSGDKETYGNLNKKMAVIYLDGNNFGKLQQDICRDENKQRHFDRTLRDKYQKNQALGGLIRSIMADHQENATPDPHWLLQKNKENGKIRLETLLWGGDEILWVVPAWKGWQVLGDFFKWSEAWNIEGRNLTHAAGLVFCHHNAPIHRIKALAMQLGDLAKQESRKENRVAYQILESFDHAGGDLDTMRKNHLPATVKTNELILHGNAMKDVVTAVTDLKEQIPKRRLYNIVQALHSTDTADKAIAGLEKELDINSLNHCFGNGYGRWLHLLELWDYIVELNKGDHHAAH